MQIPTAKVASGQLIILGASHLGSLAEFKETEPLGPAFKINQDALVDAKRAREAALLGLVAPRVGARFSEYRLEESIRGLAAAAHALDGNMVSGPAFKAICPNGLEPEVSPRGAAQLVAARALLSRLETQPAAAKPRAEYAPRLKGGIDDLGAKLEARRLAGETLGKAGPRYDTSSRTTFVHARLEKAALRVDGGRARVYSAIREANPSEIDHGQGKAIDECR